MSIDLDAACEAAKGLPLPERFSHSIWKARVEAFEEVLPRCAAAETSEDNVLVQVGSLLPKAIRDTNVAAQEKAMDLLLVVLEKVEVSYAAKYGRDISAAIVEKTLSGRPGTVKRANQVMMMLIEMEGAEQVLEVILSKGIIHKVPKAQLAAVNILVDAVTLFGTNIVPPKPIVQAIPCLFTAKDAKVREAVKLLVASLVSYMGKASLGPVLLDKMSDAMRKDLEMQINNMEPLKPARMLRKDMENDIPDNMDEDQASSFQTEIPAAEGEGAETGVDANDLVDPVDVLRQLPHDFFENVRAAKWSTRRDAFQHLLEVSSVPRIAQSDFREVVGEIRKVVGKDSNVSVITVAVKCLGNLAKGLRRDFQVHARNLCPSLLEKFKDKNAPLVTSCRETLDLFAKYSFDIMDVFEEVTGALAHKNPKVRALTGQWLAALIARGNRKSALDLQKSVLPVVAKRTNDSDPSVRAAAFETLLAFASHFQSVQFLNAVADQIDDSKTKKLLDMLDEKRTDHASLQAKSCSATLNVGGSQRLPTKSSSRLATIARKGCAAVGAACPSSSVALVNHAQAQAGKSTNRTQALDKLRPRCVPMEELQRSVGLLIGPAILVNLQSAIWKERLEAINILFENVKEMGDALEPNTTSIVCFLCEVPGWGEKNFQVMAKVIDVFSFLAATSTTFNKPEACAVLDGITEKISDAKLKSACTECLNVISEAVGPEFVSSIVHDKASSHKNPKVLCEVLVWIADVLQDFGVQCIDIRQLLDWLKSDLQSTNAAVRNAAVNTLGILHTYHGASLRSFLSDVKPALMASIDLAFTKYPYEGENNVAPKRPIRCTENSSISSDHNALLRTDISGHITKDLIAQLGSANWKDRQAALQNVNQIIQLANCLIEASIGDLMPALRARLADTNKNLVTLTLSLLETLSMAMGPPVERFTRIIFPDALKNLNDNKKNVREAVLAMSEKWNNAIESERAILHLLAASDDQKIGADGRADVLLWLAQHIDHANFSVECADEVLRICTVGLVDKTSQVREASAELLNAFTAKHGHSVFQVQFAGQFVDKYGPALACLKRAGLLLQEPRTPVARSVPLSGKTKPLTASKSALRVPRAASKLGSAHLVEQIHSPSGPILLSNNLKEERAKRYANARMKYEEPRTDAADLLQKEIGGFIREDLLSGLFDTDFKNQCKSMETVKGCLEDAGEDLVGNLDILFKLIVIKMCEGNMQVLIKSLELCQRILSVLSKNGYKLLDFEAAIIIPCVVEKSGHNQDRIKKMHRGLMGRFSSVYPPSKVFAFIIDGLQSKNNRTRVECVEEAGDMIEAHGMEIVGRTTIVAIASLVAERDASLRSSALSTLATIYFIIGEDVWRLAGRLTDAQRSLMEEKFKYKVKQLARKGITVGQKTTRNGIGSAALQHDPLNEQEPQQPNFDRHGKFQPIGPVSATPNAKWHTPEATTVRYSPSGEPLSHELGQSLVQIRTNNVDENIEGMKVFCHELMQIFTGEEDANRIAIFARVTDDFVSILAGKLKDFFALAAAESANGVRACKYVLNSLMQVFQYSALAQAVLEGTLRVLLIELLTLLLDQQLLQLYGGTQLLKALNLLTLKILENAKPDYSFSILLSFIRQPASYFLKNPVQEKAALSELIIKCLVKLTKGLPSCIHELDKESLLLSIHAFLLSYAADGISIESDAEDKSLRMVKTILFVLTKLLGPDIRFFLSRVPRDIDPAPAIHNFIDIDLEKLYSTGVLLKEAPQSPDLAQGVEASSAELSIELKAELAIIFRKIGEKATTSEGLENLYDFKATNPSVDVGKHLAKTSDAFRLYIERGLKRVEMQRQSSERRSQLNELNHTDVRSSLASLEERMKQIRQRERLELGEEQERSRPTYTLDDIKSQVQRIQGQSVWTNIGHPAEGTTRHTPAYTIAQLQERMAQLRKVDR